MERKDRVRFEDVLVLVKKISQEPTNQEEVRTREKLKEKLKKTLASLGEKQIGLIFWLGKKLVEGEKILYGAFAAAGMTSQPKNATIIIHKFWAIRKVTTLRRMGDARLSLDDLIQLGLARLEIARNSSSPKIVYYIGKRFGEAAKRLEEQGNFKAAEILKKALPRARSFNPNPNTTKNVPKENGKEKEEKK